jgi:hypothetical protein
VTRAFHRGAVVSVRAWAPPTHGDRRYMQIFQWDLLRDHSQERTGAQLAVVAKPSRQRRKGPIIRFGGRKP